MKEIGEGDSKNDLNMYENRRLNHVAIIPKLFLQNMTPQNYTFLKFETFKNKPFDTRVHTPLNENEEEDEKQYLRLKQQMNQKFANNPLYLNSHKDILMNAATDRVYSGDQLVDLRVRKESIGKFEVLTGQHSERRHNYDKNDREIYLKKHKQKRSIVKISPDKKKSIAQKSLRAYAN